MSPIDTKLPRGIHTGQSDMGGLRDPSPDQETWEKDMVREVELQINVHGNPITVHMLESATVAQLSQTLAESLSIDPQKQKLMVTPKPGIIKPPFPDTPLSAILTPKTKITLLGNTHAEISQLSAGIADAQAASRRRLTAQRDAPKAARNRDWKKVQEESTYTFHSIRPLPQLPKPDRSRRFLERLASDPGVKTAMRAHKFSVGLLTEMNPAEHTTHESRTLGLNRNRGEVIELRLRTDAYDGYRDYKVIRKTLCHELAHNVFGDHDRQFWDLTAQIEKEVERNDWKHGGHRLGDEEFYNPDDRRRGGKGEGEEEEEQHVDAGGWTGGEYVLGGSDQSSVGSNASAARGGDTAGLSRREILARAADARAQKDQQAKERRGK